MNSRFKKERGGRGEERKERRCTGKLSFNIIQCIQEANSKVEEKEKKKRKGKNKGGKARTVVTLAGNPLFFQQGIEKEGREEKKRGRG